VYNLSVMLGFVVALLSYVKFQMLDVDTEVF